MQWTEPAGIITHYVMQRDIHVITRFICGLVILSGCGAQVTTTPAEPKPTTQKAVARDAAVLQIVFDDMLSKDNADSPEEWTGDQSKPVYVSKNAPAGPRLDAGQVLSLSDAKKLKALTNADRGAATEAADDLVARAKKGESLPELRSTSGRVKIYEEAGAATQPTSDNPLAGERGSHVFLPGYSKNGRYAVVRLAFPWSGWMHSGVATYILERTDGSWRVLLRDFIYYA